MARPRLAEIESGAEVNWLFVDLNSYFASVEQHERPELRGRPMAVVPLDTPNTVCIAASYEAKAVGVKTGTKVREARRLCPEIVLVESRPRVYVEYHQAIMAAVETCLPIERVMSVDEAACRLAGLERRLPNALNIAAAVKQAVRGVGETLRCSIGLAPSRYLAKVASDMQKPDGLTVLTAADLPQALLRLKPGDLPGIGPRTQARLAARGIATMAQLLALNQAELGQAWGSVWGERLWLWLRGEDFEEPSSGRKSLGRQHVLAPEYRTRERAYEVAAKLLHSAAVELRRLGLWAGGLGVAVNFLDDGKRASGPWVNSPSWKATARIAACRDAFTLQAHLRRLWQDCPPRAPILVYVWMYELAPDAEQPGSLFAADSAARDRLSAAMDAVNRKYGAQTLQPGSVHAADGAAPQRIPFRSIPGLEKF